MSVKQTNKLKRKSFAVKLIIEPARVTITNRNFGSGSSARKTSRTRVDSVSSRAGMWAARGPGCVATFMYYTDGLRAIVQLSLLLRPSATREKCDSSVLQHWRMTLRALQMGIAIRFCRLYRLNPTEWDIQRLIFFSAPFVNQQWGLFSSNLDDTWNVFWKRLLRQSSE